MSPPRPGPNLGSCSVCEGSALEVDEGGYLFCGHCGARENFTGEFLPLRTDERDYAVHARGLEACGLCGGRNTRRESDDEVFCFDCATVDHRPVPERWLPTGANCRLNFRCALPSRWRGLLEGWPEMPRPPSRGTTRR